MTAMDFPPNTAHPAAPVAGDKWPVPPVPGQPVYIWDGVKWTTLDNLIDDVVGPSVTVPKMDGLAAVGTENNWSRGDHVHPTDTSRAPVDSPTFTTLAKAPTPVGGSNDTSIATTAFVTAAIVGGGQPVPTSSTFAIGTFAMLVLEAGLTVANNGTTSGVNLSVPAWMAGAGGYVVQSVFVGSRQTGTWKNVSGAIVGTGSPSIGFVGYFVRTA